jgi:hypothetical protein
MPLIGLRRFECPPAMHANGKKEQRSRGVPCRVRIGPRIQAMSLNRRAECVAYLEISQSRNNQVWLVVREGHISLSFEANQFSFADRNPVRGTSKFVYRRDRIVRPD